MSIRHDHPKKLDFDTFIARLSINDCSRFWGDSSINREPVIMRRLDCAL